MAGNIANGRLEIQGAHGHDPETDGAHHGEAPHDGAFLVAGAEKNRCRIEGHVQRKEEGENPGDEEGDNFGQDSPCAEQHEQGHELQAGRHDKGLAEFRRDNPVLGVHGVGSPGSTAGKGDVQDDGGQEGDSSDGGCDNHLIQN